VVADRKAEPIGHSSLTLLNPGIDELLHPTAIETQNVIVVRAGAELEHRHAFGEVVARDETRCLELREHAVHRGQPDVLARVNQLTVDVFR